MFEDNAFYQNNNRFFILLHNIIQSNPKAYSNIISHSYPELKKWIDNQLPLLSSNAYTLSTKCYWILNNMIDFPICPTCGKNNGFKDKNVRISNGYHRFCCSRCAQLNPEVNEHKKQSCKRSLGVEHPLQAKKCMDKYHKTCEKNFGVDHNFKSQKCIEKRHKTWIDNYGYDHPMMSTTVKGNFKQSFKEKHGVENPSQLPEIQQKKEETSLKHYGVKFPTQSEIVKNKTTQTCIEKYSVEHYVQSDDYKEKTKKKYLYENMYFHSAPELATYIWLKDNHLSFKYQPNLKFKYKFNGKMHFYMPDFLIEGKIVEIKGDHFFKSDGTMQNPYDHSQDALYEAKHQCMLKNNVEIWRYEKYMKYIKYVEHTYGKNYILSFKLMK